jgi:adenosine/AMP kinase
MRQNPGAPGSFQRFRQWRVRIIGFSFVGPGVAALVGALLTSRPPLLATAALLGIAGVALVRLSGNLPDADAPASENKAALTLMGVAFVCVLSAAVVAGLSAG